MKALVLALLLLALLSTQLPSPTFAQTNCTLNSCAVTVSRSITTNNWGVTFVSDQFSLTTGASPVSQITLGIPSSLASRLRFTQAVDSQATQLRISPPTGTSQSILDVIANRTITLAQTGSIQVTDFYDITNKGHDLATIALPVPKNVQSAIASDIIPSVATLTPSTAPDGTTSVSFAPRFGTLKNGGSSSTRITYSLPTQSYLTSKGLGRFELSFRLLDNVKFFEPVLETKILTPVGFRLDSLSGQTFTISGNQILVQVSTVTPMSNLSFTMDYQLDPFWASVSALGWAGLAVGSIAAIVLAVGATGTAGVTVSGAPSELIGRFVELYDEKSAMRLEAEKMEEDLSRGALNRHEYKRRKRVIELRIAELDKTLAPIKDQLSKANPRYQDMIKRLERADADIQVVRTTSADLRNQYRSARIARELYESLISDLAKRKEKAQQTMDTIVINLREETR